MAYRGYIQLNEKKNIMILKYGIEILFWLLILGSPYSFDTLRNRHHNFTRS